MKCDVNRKKEKNGNVTTTKHNDKLLKILNSEEGVELRDTGLEYFLNE